MAISSEQLRKREKEVRQAGGGATLAAKKIYKKYASGGGGGGGGGGAGGGAGALEQAPEPGETPSEITISVRPGAKASEYISQLPPEYRTPENIRKLAEAANVSRPQEVVVGQPQKLYGGIGGEVLSPVFRGTEVKRYEDLTPEEKRQYGKNILRESALGVTLSLPTRERPEPPKKPKNLVQRYFDSSPALGAIKAGLAIESGKTEKRAEYAAKIEARAKEPERMLTPVERGVSIGVAKATQFFSGAEKEIIETAAKPKKLTVPFVSGLIFTGASKVVKGLKPGAVRTTAVGGVGTAATLGLGLYAYDVGKEYRQAETTFGRGRVFGRVTTDIAAFSVGGETFKGAETLAKSSYAAAKGVPDIFKRPKPDVRSFFEDLGPSQKITLEYVRETKPRGDIVVSVGKKEFFINELDVQKAMGRYYSGTEMIGVDPSKHPKIGGSKELKHTVLHEIGHKIIAEEVPKIKGLKPKEVPKAESELLKPYLKQKKAEGYKPWEVEEEVKADLIAAYLLRKPGAKPRKPKPNIPTIRDNIAAGMRQMGLDKPVKFERPKFSREPIKIRKTFIKPETYKVTYLVAKKGEPLLGIVKEVRTVPTDEGLKFVETKRIIGRTESRFTTKKPPTPRRGTQIEAIETTIRTPEAGRKEAVFTQRPTAILKSQLPELMKGRYPKDIFAEVKGDIAKEGLRKQGIIVNEKIAQLGLQPMRLRNVLARKTRVRSRPGKGKAEVISRELVQIIPQRLTEPKPRPRAEKPFGPREYIDTMMKGIPPEQMPTIIKTIRGTQVITKGGKSITILRKPTVPLSDTFGKGGTKVLLETKKVTGKGAKATRPASITDLLPKRKAPRLRQIAEPSLIVGTGLVTKQIAQQESKIPSRIPPLVTSRLKEPITQPSPVTIQRQRQGTKIIPIQIQTPIQEQTTKLTPVPPRFGPVGVPIGRFTFRREGPGPKTPPALFGKALPLFPLGRRGISGKLKPRKFAYMAEPVAYELGIKRKKKPTIKDVFTGIELRGVYSPKSLRRRL